MKKFLSSVLATVMIVVMLPLSSAIFAADADVIISEDGTFTVGSCASLTVDNADAIVLLDNAVIHGVGGSAIVIKNGSNVTLKLQGNNTVSGDASVASAGICVEYGSTLTIEGNGALNVTGGKYGAGIGSFGTGTNVAPELRTKVGTITINSGSIVAHGGANGAGIGSGYHVDGNLVIINGGTVYAYGTGGGAGIGSGYGTSGGAAPLAAVGDYDAGKIVINGGTVYASAFDIDFASVDIMNPATYSAIDKNTFAAGIGGGYGASASSVEISGGTVFAIGSCGGAGIGSGRGTSKAKNYDENAFRVNVTIGGDADVTAIACDDERNHKGGGAAIGSGRGTHTGGNVTITGSAKVTAIASPYAAAIGAGAEVSPVDGSKPVAESITIGEGVTLYAAAIGREALDTAAARFVVADIIGHNDEIPASATDSEVTLGTKTYTVPANTLSLWANIASVSSGKTVSLGIVCPKKMSVRFEDGTVYYGGESIPVEIGKEYRFQMCSNDWDTDTYTDDGHGIAGTVVYTVKVSDNFTERSFDPETKTFVLPKGDPVLRTDVNKCFMAYRYHFRVDYNKQTGIEQVVNTPLESLSVNLPLGSTIKSDAYLGYKYKATEYVFIENDLDMTRSYTDYNWTY